MWHLSLRVWPRRSRLHFAGDNRLADRGTLHCRGHFRLHPIGHSSEIFFRPVRSFRPKYHYPPHCHTLYRRNSETGSLSHSGRGAFPRPARWKVIFFIILPGSLPGILTGVFLAISRAIGETAPLIFTAFGNMYTSYSPLRPMASMPVQIYNYAISPYEDWRQQAWTGSLVLILLVLGFNLLSRGILYKDKIFQLLRRKNI